MGVARKSHLLRFVPY